MSSHFFAMISRMKYINRWGLMNNTQNETICEHSLQVAMFTHCMILMHNEMFENKLDADHGAILAIYHDSSEIITGDLPTPVKYYNDEITKAYKEVENLAEEQLLSMLPKSREKYYRDILHYNEKDKELWKYVKAADKISALTKCICEMNMGNSEFGDAYYALKSSIEEMKMPVVNKFLEEYIPSFRLTLDKLK